ncbi:MAG: Inositol 2-dehydrogenase/D-chiro-inositol 3-dehydrogenase [Chroococcopsis gigantea SAG 12.99]|jgi:predicted dehydrogenase|nr:Gfo/Idh/MocA family oxidoreductase [Chlorogloea purpurea SAG 13.99]MDV3000550.1 Inositol 2-dehydrogenase/D-chiro-inositol 3-dehydrogenase [Chroococcopsis gigantea SAG 12.99]
MTKAIGVAIVGTGFGEKIHIPGFQHHHRTEIVAVYHRDRNKAGVIADKYGISYASDRLEEILALREVNGVSISTPPGLHYEMAKATLEAGKHLLLEKPMTLKAGETKSLYELARKKDLIATADFEFRFIPAWQLLREYLERNYVGKIRLIKADWLVAGRADPERPWNWYSREDMGGGILGAVGSHVFDYLHWLFGPAQRVWSYLNCAIPQRPDPLSGNEMKPVTAEDTCLLMLELAHGIPCQVSLSSVTYNGRGHWLEIYGSEGTLVLGSDNQKDYVHGFRLLAAPKGESLKEIAIPPRLDFPQVFADGRLAPFIRVVDRWVESIDKGQSLAPSLKEGYYSQLLMDLTRQSHERGCAVDVPDISTLF